MHIKFDFLNDPGSPIFDEKLERAKCVLNASPFLGLAIQFLPQLFHNNTTLLAKGEFSICTPNKCSQPRPGVFDGKYSSSYCKSRQLGSSQARLSS